MTNTTTYLIARMFGSGKVWRVVRDSPPLTSEILDYKWYSYGQNLSIRQP